MKIINKSFSLSNPSSGADSKKALDEIGEQDEEQSKSSKEGINLDDELLGGDCQESASSTMSDDEFIPWDTKPTSN